MKLSLNGVSLDENVENEIFPENEFGLHAIITNLNGKVHHRRNLTEVHHRYNEGRGDEHRCAFESDIHQTGGTVRLSEVGSIEIFDESKIAEDYWAEN